MSKEDEYMDSYFSHVVLLVVAVTIISVSRENTIRLI